VSARRIAVLGGGISGLSAAYRCRELARGRGEDVELAVFERAPHAGGCIRTLRRDGVVAELGPDSLATEKPAALALIKRLHLDGEITPMREEFRGARVVRAGKLVAIPDDFRFFAPTSLAGLLRSRLFSPAGLARAACEPFLAPRRADDDESLAAFVSRRFGREVLERLAQPLIGGIYSGDPQRLSMRETLPQMWALERKYGSIVRGIRAGARVPRGERRMQPLVSLRGGLGQLTGALERELGDAVQTSSAVARLSRQDAASAWRVALENGGEREFDAVICALPAHAAAGLFAEQAPLLAEQLRSIVYHAVATITLTYRSDVLPPLPRCTGFVVPYVERSAIMSATFCSQKYPDRSPADVSVIRAFAGGAMQPAVLALDDDGLIGAVRDELRALLAIDAVPAWTLVQRWPRALPEYSLGHADTVARIEAEAGRLPGLMFAGAAYHGAGIADCVRSAESAAEQALR
jgi:oxygen-dependent protoporphyrinogen oxidase